jgi:hypothetical protein
VKTLGIKVSSKKVDNGWKGYWRCFTNNINIENVIDIIRTNQYDAEKDAIIDAKQFSEMNDIAFISEGYRI